MSRLFIANRQSIVEENTLLSGEFLPKYSTHSNNEWFAVFYEKKKQSLGNTYSDEKGNFIGIVGTFLYKGVFGTAAAKLILEDFDGDVAHMKKSIQGIYSAYVVKRDETTIFNDYYGLYDTCWYQNNGISIIGTSLEDVAVASKSVEIDEFSFMLNIFHTGCFGDRTSFKNIYKLTGDQYITIGQGQTFAIQTISNTQYRVDVLCDNDQQALEYIKMNACECSSQIKNTFKNISLCMTGGLDSRTMCATFSAEDADITMYYGRGNSLLTPTRIEDEQVVQQISNRYRYPVVYLDWRHPEASESIDWQYQDRLFREYGFLNSIYIGNRNFIDECREKIFKEPCFLDFGCVMEAMRLRKWAEDLGRDYFTLDEYVDKYFIDKHLNDTNYPNIKAFREYIKDIFRAYLQRFVPDLSEDRISMDYFERLRWQTARYSDTRVHFMMNEFGYSFPVYGVPAIHEAILGLSADVISNGRFQIKFLQMLNSSMLELPVFSHRRYYKITSDGSKKMVITPKNIMTILLNKFPVLKRPIVWAYRKVVYRDYDHNKSVIREQLNDLQNNKLKLPIDLDKFSTDGITQLYLLRQFMVGYNNLINR